MVGALPVVGAIVPWVALHATGINGNVPDPVVSTALELSVMSAVMVEVSNGSIVLGAAVA